MKLAPLLMTAAALAAAVVLMACEPGNIDGYTWYRAGPPSKDYDWFVVSADEVNAACGARPGETFSACTFQLSTGFCHVYSLYTEADARKFTPSGPLGKTTLFQHEVWDDQANPTLGHCAGFNHRERHLRRV